MSQQITKDDLKGNTLFWYFYISLFRGHDDINEINIDEALEVISINKDDLFAWETVFFPQNKEDEFIRFIEIKINETTSCYVEFQKHEIVFFINDIYVGNLGGHFEAWFLTWNELLAFQQYEYLFLLFLPMAGVEEYQIAEALTLIAKYLKTIPKFEDKADYIARCILNGIKIDGQYSYQNEIGIVNNQNHSVRNIKKYPEHKDNVIKLNNILKKLAN